MSGRARCELVSGIPQGGALRAWFGCIVLALLAGCGSVSEDDYPTAYAEARCAWTIDCYPGIYANFNQCVGDFDDGESGLACTYDGDAAKECLAGLEDQTCPTDGSVPEFPEACLAVHSECTGTTAE